MMSITRASPSTSPITPPSSFHPFSFQNRPHDLSRQVVGTLDPFPRSVKDQPSSRRVAVALLVVLQHARRVVVPAGDPRAAVDLQRHPDLRPGHIRPPLPRRRRKTVFVDAVQPRISRDDLREEPFLPIVLLLFRIRHDQILYTGFRFFTRSTATASPVKDMDAPLYRSDQQDPFRPLRHFTTMAISGGFL